LDMSNKLKEAWAEIVVLKELIETLRDELNCATNRITELNSEAVQQDLLIETLRDELNYYTAREYDEQQNHE
jgi:chromosome segregation ATPase